MARRMTAAAAALLTVTLSIASPLVEAQTLQGAPALPALTEGGEDDARNSDPCLPVTANALGSSSSARELSRRGSLRRRPVPLAGRRGTVPFAQTELYFGTNKPDGVVSDAEFGSFLDNQITPRFPDGLTVVKGDGQFRGGDGEVIKEASFVLILLYPLEVFAKSTRRIESIRQCYLQQFDQESVLRVDQPFAAWISF